MIELLLCSLITILPDYLYRRYAQGKRIGREITLYSVWFELRYGITACVLLTVLLFTLIFYFHPTATNAVALFRTVPILPETSGRVEEVYVRLNDKVKAGDPIFRLDSTAQQAALDTAKKREAQVDAAIVLAKAEVDVSNAQVAAAQSAYQQAVDELETKSELMARNSQTVSKREIERLQNLVNGRQAEVDAMIAKRRTVETQIDVVLPAEKASATAALNEALIALDKTTVRAGVDGLIRQFTLRRGDIVNPFMRPAGVLIPSQAGRGQIIAGFNQIEAQVIRPGLLAEAACISRPMVIIPLVVVEVQDLIASGQIRTSDQLVDLQQSGPPGTITAFLEPLYPGGLDAVPPGSTCIVNAYTDNHDKLASGDVGPLQAFALHAIDTVGLVHAIVLRFQALLMPITTLVLSGH